MNGKSEGSGDVLKAVENLAALASKDAVSTEDGGELVTLSTGVVLEVYAGVSLQRLLDLDTMFPDPPVPQFMFEGRMQDNPNSPSYQQAVKENQTKKSLAAIESVIVLSTRVHSIPAGIPSPDSEEWIETLDVLGYKSNTRISRYMQWVKLKAAPSDSDIAALSASAFRKLGVREEDVSQALDGFRNPEAGDTDQPGNAA